ncbi:MAG: hypothetical protein AAGI03_13875 [Pseudomonadota bacterium]
MTYRLTAFLAATALALTECATTDEGEGGGVVPNLFDLTSSYDSRLESQVASAMSSSDAESLTANVDAIAALAEEAQGKADAAGDDSDARLVWLSISANAYDQAALLTPAGIDAVKTYRGEVFSTTSALEEVCSAGTSDTRLGYRCAAGKLFQVLNGSETALAEFEAAAASGDVAAARTSAEAYGVSVTQDWPTYQAAIADFPLGDQDLTPISERQIANACGFNAAAHSGSPTWLNSMRTLAQSGDNGPVFARNAYIYAAADVAALLRVEPTGDACEADGEERSPRCAGQLENGLTFFCNAQSQ